MKRALRLSLVIAIMVVMLAGCGNNSGNTNGSNGSEIALKVNGREISIDEYNYYIAENAVNYIYAENSSFDGNFEGYDWNKKNKDGKTASEIIKETAEENLIKDVIFLSVAEKNGIKLSDEEKAQADQLVQQLNSQSPEAQKATLKRMGIGSIEGFKKVFELVTVIQKAKNDFAQNADKYITDDMKSELIKYRNDKKVSVQHVLIMADSEKTDNPRAMIEEIRKRALDGENFVDLMNEFGEDPGQSEGGYSFGKGEMVPEFEAASFALDYDEISDVVESSYGYHIIKRIVGLAELENYLLENAEIERKTKIIDKIKVQEILN